MTKRDARESVHKDDFDDIVINPNQIYVCSNKFIL